LRAGAACSDITPDDSVFLFGYPHVPRWSTGIHDRLECSAFYLEEGDNRALFIAHDLIFVPREMVVAARSRITRLTGMPEHAIMLTATHTHSGPVTVDYLSNAADAVVPKADARYLARLVDVSVETAVRAVRNAEPAEIGRTVVSVNGTGSNRHDPDGPADREVPLLVARARRSKRVLAAMVVHAMHPTVLHEDSTLLSGDFPHFTRALLRSGALPADCPFLFHQGASGNQSPRHVTRGNTLAEAQRLGEILGHAIASALPLVTFSNTLRVRCACRMIDLFARQFPLVEAAEHALRDARMRFETLREAGAAAPVVRTAQCDVFGAEETAELARAATDGRLAAVIAERRSAEIQVLSVDDWNFVGWPGEFFVEYALEVRRRAPGTYVVTIANGELQGYIVTPDAAMRGSYEALNAVFAAENGARFVDATLDLIARSS
jgi:hypothetical protein